MFTICRSATWWHALGVTIKIVNCFLIYGSWKIFLPHKDYLKSINGNLLIPGHNWPHELRPVVLLSLLAQQKTCHCNDVIMNAIASQITSLMIVYSTVYSDADKRKHQSSASLVFVRGIQRWPMNSLHKRPVTRKMLSFDDVIMQCLISIGSVDRGSLILNETLKCGT